MSIESVMPSHRLILCCLLLPLQSVFPSIRVFPDEQKELSVSWRALLALCGRTILPVVFSHLNACHPGSVFSP